MALNEELYKKIKINFKNRLPRLFAYSEKRKIPIKFVISGGIATLVDLWFLYFFTDILNIWYLISSIFAFIIAFAVSFSLQKFWTFRDNNLKKVRKQLYSYLAVALTNLFLNSNGIFIFVDKFKIHYLSSQIIISAILGLGSFIIYRFLIFERPHLEEN